MNAPAHIDPIKAEILAEAMDAGESLRALEKTLTTRAQKRAAKVFHAKLERLRRHARHVGFTDDEVTTMGGGGTNKEK